MVKTFIEDIKVRRKFCYKLTSKLIKFLEKNTIISE